MSEAVIAEPLVTEAEARVAVATQRQLIWWRFRKHKLAMVSAVIVGLFYLVAIFADMIAYAPPFDTEAARSYIPPQPIHWFDADGSFHPHVFALKGKRDPRTFKLTYAPDPSEPRDLVLFAHGYPYNLSSACSPPTSTCSASPTASRRTLCSCSAPISWGATCSPASSWPRAPRSPSASSA